MKTVGLFEQFKTKFSAFNRQHIIQNSRYRNALCDLPASLYPHWQQTAKHEFNGIPGDAVFFIRAAEGLLMFFDCVRRSEKACGLPSKAADSVWHAWLSLPQVACAAVPIDEFCLKHYVRVIPHVEASKMEGEMGVALANTLVQARKIERRGTASNYVPKLFSLDRRLKMPDGFSYRAAGEQLGFQAMNLAGESTGRMQYPTSFQVGELWMLGLLGENVYADYQRKQASKAKSGSDGGGSFSCGSDSGGGDGGGGACCGSSCGGGCGGGCGS